MKYGTVKVIGIKYDITDEDVLDYAHANLNLSIEEAEDRIDEIRQQIIADLPTEHFIDYYEDEDFNEFVEAIPDIITDTVGWIVAGYEKYIFVKKL